MKKHARLHDIAMARRVLQERYEPCPKLVAVKAPNTTHHWLLEECIFCGTTRPSLPEGWRAPGEYGRRAVRRGGCVRLPPR